MSIVYVVYNQHKRDEATGEIVPKFDFKEAEQYGEIRFLLQPSVDPRIDENLVDELYDKLEDFSDDDFLLLVGSPVLMGWATAVASEMNDGVVSILTWDRANKTYIPITEDLKHE